MIDFKRSNLGIRGRVFSIEYDPNRSSRIALINYINGEKRYILCPTGLVIGDFIISDFLADIKVGNCLPLKTIPSGTFLHNIEFQICLGFYYLLSD